MSDDRSRSVDDGGGASRSNTRMHPLLRVAILKGKPDAVRMQLAAGVYVDGVDARGWTALMLAVDGGHAEICRLLLDAGADPFFSDSVGRSAARLAAVHNDLRHLFPDAGRSPTDVTPNHELGRWGDADSLHVTVERRSGARIPDDSQLAVESDDVIKGIDPVDVGRIVDRVIPEPVAKSDRWAAFCEGLPPAGLAPAPFETEPYSSMQPPPPDGAVGEWEAEDTPRIPDDDDRVGFGDSSCLNKLIARHRALDDAGEWDEVAVVLPAARPRRASRAIERDGLTEARCLFRRAARDGFLSRSELQRVLDEHYADAPTSGRALEIALDSFVMLVDDHTPPSIWPGNVTDDLEQVDDGLSSEASDEAFQRFLELADAPHDRMAQLISSRAAKPLAEDEVRRLCGRLADHCRRAERVITSELPGIDLCDSGASIVGLRQLLKSRVNDTHTLSELIGLETEWRIGLTRLVIGNLRLVRSCALRFARPGVDIEDLIQEGVLGLLRAIQKFDPHRSMSFSTYAKWWVRAAISRHLGSAMVVEAPGGAIDLLRNIDEAERSLTVRGAAPTVRRIAEILGKAEKSIEGALARRLEVLYFDDSEYDEYEPFLVDPAVLQDDSVGAAQFRAVLRGHLEDLPPKQRHILLARHGFDDDEPHTLSELGARVGLSRERVRQIEFAAYETLRTHPAVAAFSSRGHP